MDSKIAATPRSPVPEQRAFAWFATVLLAAGAAGGLEGGLFLKTRGLLEPRPRTAFILAMIWCCALAGFAYSKIYAVALALLFLAGFMELAFNSMGQPLVQINAPSEIRGRLIGVFSMSSMGLRSLPCP